MIRARDGLNVNVRLVAVGAAAPTFYRGRRGRYATRLDTLARNARARRLGLCDVHRRAAKAWARANAAEAEQAQQEGREPKLLL